MVHLQQTEANSCNAHKYFISFKRRAIAVTEKNGKKI